MCNDKYIECLSLHVAALVLWYENSTKLLMLKWSDGNLIVLIKKIISAISSLGAKGFV